MNIKFIPNLNNNNKYIDLLLNGLNMSGTDHFNRGEVNIIHIHWSTSLYGSKYLFKSIFLILKNLCIYCYLKILYNIKIVWTMHNFYAHDYPHPWIDKIGRFLLSNIADAIVVHQKKSVISNKKYYFIPHINYIDAYGSKTNKDYILKRSLGFNDSDIIFLSFGAIAPYKKNEKIIEIMRKLKDFKLFIAGKGEAGYVQTLKEHVEKLNMSERVIIKNKFVIDEDVPRYLSIADYSIFYYDKSEMTSGGIILSLSYGIPVISRDIPGSKIVNKDCGYVFKSDIELQSILKNLKLEKTFNTVPSVINDTAKVASKKLRNIYKSF